MTYNFTHEFKDKRIFTTCKRSLPSMKVGIVGLPNVGKSTLFNALLKKRVALSANYPFATIEPNTGVVAVPDKRLDKLADLIASEEADPSTSLRMNRPPIVPAVVQFVDIAGLVKGASEGAGLGNQFLSHIREVDAIIHVLRDFEDANIVREGSSDPKSDRETIETELQLADLQVIDKLIDNLKKEAKLSTVSRGSDQMSQILEEIKKNLEEGKFLGKFEIGDERVRSWFNTLPLLTLKPVLYIFNVSEDLYADKLRDSSTSPLAPSSRVGITDNNALVICAKVEEELIELAEEERSEYLKELGIEEPGLDRLIKKAYSLLGLISFLTAGKKEVRAWTIKKGSLAPQAAGVIHTDFEKKFIRAQVIEYERYLEAGSITAVRTKGWVKTEGREYEIKDGDVIEFLIGS